MESVWNIVVVLVLWFLFGSLSCPLATFCNRGGHIRILRNNVSRRFNIKNFTENGGKNQQQKNQTMLPPTKKTQQKRKPKPESQQHKHWSKMMWLGACFVPVVSLLLIRCLHCTCPVVSWTYFPGWIGVVGGGFRDSEGVILISAADI